MTNNVLVIDRELVRGWKLYDVHAHEERPTLRFELTDERDRIVELEVCPAGERLAVEWHRSSADTQAAQAARALLEEALKGLPAEIGRVADAIGIDGHARVQVRDATAWRDPLLLKDFRAYRLLYGRWPRRVRVSTAESKAFGDSVEYPEPVRGTRSSAATLYPFPRRFRTRRRFREYLAKLGFVVAADDRACVVPLPETFLEGATALTGRVPAWMPSIEPLDLWRRSARSWARRVTRGVLPVSVPPPALTGLFRLLWPARRPVQPPFAPGMLAHDMSLHAFAVHRVRFEALESVVDLESLRRASFRTRRRRLYRLADWFEGPLTRAAWDVWQHVDRPEAFDAPFAAKLPSLARSFADDVLAS